MVVADRRPTRIDSEGSAAWAQALLEVVRELDFAAVPDAWNDGHPVGRMPGLDLAVAVFAPARPAVVANVLFSPELPQGWVAQMDPATLEVDNVQYLPDVQDAHGRSAAWLPGADRSRWLGATPAGAGIARFIASYPASLVKLLVAVGVARLVDLGRAQWAEAWGEPADTAQPVRTVAQWCDSMITISCNESTERLVALLHARGLLTRQAGQRTDALHDWLGVLRLHGLRLADTRPGGGWRNADGAGVGHLQMTAWDTVRLLWLLMPDAPPAPWLSPQAPPLLQPTSAAVVGQMLAQQGLHDVLSTGVLACRPDAVPGIPARVPPRWRHADGSYAVAGRVYPTPANAGVADAEFAHKTGATDTYCSDAGWVRGDDGRRYLVAMTSTLGRRHAPPGEPLCATDWRVAALGARIDALARAWTLGST